MKESSIGLRQAYTVIKNAYKAKQRNPVTTASDLRSLVPVVGGKTQYTFPIIVGEDTSNYPEAILLNRADAFTAIEMGLFIAKKSSVSDTAYDIFSYPSTNEFGTTDADTFRILFNNSTMNAQINNVQYLQNFSTARFRTTGATQQGLGFGATQAASGTITLTSSVVDEFNSGYGYTPIVPTLQLSGTSKIELTVNLPSGLTAATGGTNQYVIILALRGFLSLGASNLNK